MKQIKKRQGPRQLRVRRMDLWKNIFKQRGFGHFDILRFWDNIVGQQLAPLCIPEKLKFAPEGQSATLYIAATSESMVEIRYKIPLILERLATYLGKKVVTHIHLSTSFCPPSHPKKCLESSVTLSPEKEAFLQEKLDDMKSSELKKALWRLGRTVHES